MLLPTYDVFDESRYFQPAATQDVFLFEGQKLGITICEDIWNDKTFWAKPLYERDPVAELVSQRARPAHQYFGVSLHDRQALSASRHVALSGDKPMAGR